MHCDMLADGWEWSGVNKVRKGHKHYIRVEGTNFKYVGPNVPRTDYTLKCSGGFPYLKLAALTHHEDLIVQRIREYVKHQVERMEK